MSKEKKTTKTETTTEDDEEVVIIDVKEEPELTVEDLPGGGPATAEKLPVHRTRPVHHLILAL